MQNPQKLPLLSIIIPVFNTGAQAAKLIQKIFNDQFQDFEILVIDDGSTDDSLKFLRAAKSKNRNKPLRILAQTNQGPSSARNLGLKHAKGNYVIFLDSDDDIDPTFLTKMTAAMSPNSPQTQKPAFAVCQIQRANQRKLLRPKNFKSYNGEIPLETFVLQQLLLGDLLYSSVNKIYRNQIIKKHRLKFDETLNFAEDTMFVLNYLKAAQAKNVLKITVIPEPLYIYHQTAAGISKNNQNWQNWQTQYDRIKNWDRNQHKILTKLLKLRFRTSWLKCRLFRFRRCRTKV